jgi:hypothetical protein
MLIIPPHRYYEALASGRFSGSYWEFYPEFYTSGLVPTGHFTYRHLWFLAYLFTFSLVALPVFWLYKRSKGLQKGAVWFYTKPLLPALIVLPFIGIEVQLRAAWPVTNNLLADWANILVYGLLFILGYVLASNERILQALEAQWELFLGASIALMGVSLSTLTYAQLVGDEPASDPEYVLSCVIRASIVGFGVLGVIGIGRRFLNKPLAAFTQHLSDLAYLYYIFHQTLIIVLAYYVTQTDWSIFVKFWVIILGAASLSLIFSEAVFRSPLGFLLGVKRPPLATGAEKSDGL